MNFENEPLMPLNADLGDGRIVTRVTVDLERGPLPLYARAPGGHRVVGKITGVTFVNDAVYVSGVTLDDLVPGGIDGYSLSAETLVDEDSTRDDMSVELRAGYASAPVFLTETS